ncbi:MAG TPA: FAD-dependent oxidoreductase [Cyclobacteriaceae bacterium]|nr:FAD-dependent oxidoreductase [Cyclobacteriaceae bacterium]HNP08701.1 FAD-dependent oxidoreductase [Cyclobacteriaceae bacterium]
MSNVGIIGGGIIGLTSAYYLTQAGYKVTVIEKGNLQEGCSFGNAGMIVPSHFIPLAAPGMISKGIRWMFNSKSPFYVRPSLNPDLLKWGYLFYRNSSQANVDNAIPALKELSYYSKSLYQQMAKKLPFDFGYHERGLLMLYKTEEIESEERETAEIANHYGVEARVLTAEQVQDKEPDVRVDVRGGVYFPGDAHLTPQHFINGLIHYLKEAGVEFKTDCEVFDFRIENNKIQELTTNLGNYSFDEVILAAGSWSGTVAKRLQLSLPMQAGKGYSFTLNNIQKNVRIPSIFLEAKVAVTPMENNLRFGGTMEITGVNHKISMNRVRGIVESIPKYYPEMKVDVPGKEKVWHGLRPCSPDGLPYVGRSKQLQNLIVATGHSMLGISLGPGTGRVVADLMDGKKPDVGLSAFDPERFN